MATLLIISIISNAATVMYTVNIVIKNLTILLQVNRSYLLVLVSDLTFILIILSIILTIVFFINKLILRYFNNTESLYVLLRVTCITFIIYKTASLVLRISILNLYTYAGLPCDPIFIYSIVATISICLCHIIHGWIYRLYFLIFPTSKWVEHLKPTEITIFSMVSRSLFFSLIILPIIYWICRDSDTFLFISGICLYIYEHMYEHMLFAQFLSNNIFSSKMSSVCRMFPTHSSSLDNLSSRTDVDTNNISSVANSASNINQPRPNTYIPFAYRSANANWPLVYTPENRHFGHTTSGPDSLRVSHAASSSNTLNYKNNINISDLLTGVNGVNDDINVILEVERYIDILKRNNQISISISEDNNNVIVICNNPDKDISMLTNLIDSKDERWHENALSINNKLNWLEDNIAILKKDNAMLKKNNEFGVVNIIFNVEKKIVTARNVFNDAQTSYLSKM